MLISANLYYHYNGVHEFSGLSEYLNHVRFILPPSGVQMPVFAEQNDAAA